MNEGGTLAEAWTTELSTEQSEQIAAVVVNKEVEAHRGATIGALKSALRQDLVMPDSAQEYVNTYVAGLDSMNQEARINDLPENVGGLYNGDITIATSVLEVRSDIDTTLSQAEEVNDHETFHKENNHLQDFMTMGDGSFLVMGGQNLDETEAIEGTTVAFTGNENVSEEYKGFEIRVEAAAASAGISMETVAAAIKNNDLASIDDRAVDGVFIDESVLETPASS